MSRSHTETEHHDTEMLKEQSTATIQLSDLLKKAKVNTTEISKSIKCLNKVNTDCSPHLEMLGTICTITYSKVCISRTLQ